MRTRALLRLWTALGDPHGAVQASAVAQWRTEPAAATTVIRFLAQPGGDPRTRAAALRLLIDRSAPVATFEALAAERLAEAHTLRRFHRALQDVRASGGAALEILAIALHERQESALDLALQALEGAEDRATVAVIRAALHCGERRHRAGAIEALGELRSRALVDNLSELLQPAAPYVRQRGARRRAPPSRRSFSGARSAATPGCAPAPSRPDGPLPDPHDRTV